MITEQSHRQKWVVWALVLVLAFTPMPMATASPSLGARYDVRAYGAVPNDGQDDTAAIRAAINAAPNGQGAIIWFPAGTYISNNVMVIGRTGLRFEGEGFTSIIQRPPFAGNTRPMTVEGSVDLVFRNLAVDENGIQAYGGVNFYSVRRVLIERTRHFDSRPTPPTNFIDRYAWVFGRGGTPSEDVTIVDNVVDDLQVEVDHIRRATIARNRVSRSRSTTGIGTFTINDDTIAEDLLIEGNVIDDPARGNGISIHLDPPGSVRCTFRHITIRNNTIVRRTRNANGISIGTPNNSVQTTGNIFEDIIIEGNRIHTYGTAGPLPNDMAAIKLNNSSRALLLMQRITIRHNVMTGVGYGMDLRRLQDSLVENNDSRGGSNVFNFVEMLNIRVLNNIVDAGTGGIPYYWQFTRYGNTFRGNRYIGTVERPIQITEGDPNEVEAPTFQPNPPPVPAPPAI